ncbi:MAG: hypothetical protein ACOZCE_04625 [Spirochaetota bacterium]|jgi:hypothetical protein|uniref:hypothetical protein n=1 Tax=Gracilinema caldarium TaxID=215591 RepID=UPI0016905308|nr:hypothetical protein [Gracilinema caldarium]NLJ09937.1 hypothetical protein [Treponema sp.]
MKVKTGLHRLTCKILYESLSMDMIVRIARIIMPGYDIHRQSGIPENIPITAQTAAEQVVKDIIAAGRYLQLIELLIKIDTTGYMGRDYPLLYMRDLIKTILSEGYSYDSVTGLFMENAHNQISPNWGRLVPGDEFQLALLRLDIVHNSELVRKHDKRVVDAAYADLRNMVSRAVLPRMGRLWFWEGDGCLAAFVFGKKERSAVLAGMEILHNLFFYNRLSNSLGTDLQVRLAVHGGPVKYAEDPQELKKNETIREIADIESNYGRPGTLMVTSNVFLSIDRVIQERFCAEVLRDSYKLRNYTIQVEQL